MNKPTTLDMVQEFHEVFGLDDHTHDEPGIPSAAVCLTRIQGITEEVAELAHAMGKGDVVEALDALTDIQYFLDGTYLALGLGDFKHPAMVEVHRSNMTKLDENGRPIRDASGRVVKGPNYEPPKLEELFSPW